MHRSNSKLKLEFLESRMLLSAIDIPQDAISAGVKDGAIDSTDAHVQVDWNEGAHRLTITGPHDGDLTVNLDDLPTNVTVLQVSSFDSVKLTGEHSFYSVVLSDVGQADLGKATESYAIAAFNVDRIHIDTVQCATVLLAGAGVFGSYSVGNRTLFEAGGFADNVLIISDVELLGLTSSSPVHTLSIENEAPNPTVLMNFQPDTRLNRDGFDDADSQISVITGDFDTYFLAPPSEQAVLEQSLLVTRHPAITSSAPLTDLLADFTLSSLFSPRAETETIPPFAIHPHVFSVGNSIAQVFSENQTVHEYGTVAAMKLPFDAVAAPIVAAEPSVHFNSVSNAASGTPIKLSAFGAFDLEAHPNEHFGEAVANAMHALTSRLGQPLAWLASDFGSGVATFGDLVAARVSEHLKIDNQYALLVDGRPTRSSDDRELFVFSI